MAKVIDSLNNQTCKIGGVSSGNFVTDAASIGTGQAFLKGELEKMDPTLNEPLTSTTYARDIVINTGGGFVETTSNMFADYAGAGDATSGLIRGATNNIPIIQSNVSKDVYKTYLWSNVLQVNFIDQEKMKNIGRALENMLDNGIKLNFGKTMDWICYKGIEEDNVYGLINNPNITSTLADVGASGQTDWKHKTADEIVADVHLLINACWAAAQYDISGMPNHILIPPENYTYIASKKVSEAGNVTILQYILENNIAKAKGQNLVIDECRWCIGAGVSGKNRMLAYVNAKNRTEMDLTQPLTRAMTAPVPQQLCYMTPFVANIGQVKFLYYECAMYCDGI